MVRHIDLGKTIFISGIIIANKNVPCSDKNFSVAPCLHASFLLFSFTFLFPVVVVVVVVVEVHVVHGLLSPVSLADVIFFYFVFETFPFFFVPHSLML